MSDWDLGLSGHLVQRATLRHMQLSAQDLTMAAEACRALAERYRKDAERYDSPTLREAALEQARDAERLARFFEFQRDRV
jgi:hypothetical protein